MAETTTVLKALADANRLRIFAALMSGDSCNCELREELGLAPNLPHTMSYQLLIIGYYFA